MGQRNAIECALAQHTYDPAQVEIVHADQVIEMHEEPSAAVHARRDASVVVGTQLVKRAAAVRSSPQGTRVPLWPLRNCSWDGCTAYAELRWERIIPPCTACAWSSMWVPPPTASPKTSIKSESWGTPIAQGVLGLAEPKVGLLSSGEEEGKGSVLVERSAPTAEVGSHSFRRERRGKDIPYRPVDVVVTDGFTVTFSSRLPKGFAALLLKTLEREIKRRPHATLGALLAKQAFRLRKRAWITQLRRRCAARDSRHRHRRSQAVRQQSDQERIRVAKQAVDSNVMGVITGRSTVTQWDRIVMTTRGS